MSTSKQPLGLGRTQGWWLWADTCQMSKNCKFLLQKTRNDWHITLFSIWHGPQLSYLDGEELRKQEENNPNTNIE